jgi:SRSO17 transposase
VRQYALPAMQRQGAIEAWIVDDTGLVKKGTHSVGVTRQYCGQVGKQENCRVAVSLSEHPGGKFADCLASLLTRSVGSG